MTELGAAGGPPTSHLFYLRPLPFASLVHRCTGLYICFPEFSLILLAGPEPLPELLWDVWSVEQGASGISKSPRQGRLEYELYLSRPDQPYDLGVIIFLILLMGKVSHRASTHFPQITQPVSHGPGICSFASFLYPQQSMQSHSPLSLEWQVPKCSQPITEVQCSRTVKKKIPVPHLRLTASGSLGRWAPGVFNKLPW